MYKVLHFIKRKPHMTHEQFKEHFERSHAAMALKFCGHLFSEYRRNYVNVVYTGGDSRDDGLTIFMELLNRLHDSRHSINRIVAQLWA